MVSIIKQLQLYLFVSEKKRSSCRYAHGLSRRPQGLKEVTPDVVTSSGRPSARSAPCPCIENVFLPTNSVSVLVHEEADRSANIASLAYCYLHWVICLNFSRFHYFRFFTILNSPIK